MATGTFPGRAAIRYNTSAVDLATLGMTQLARNLFVSSGQRKRARSFVTEQRGRPMNRVVARRAIYRLGSFLELPGMDVLMATHAAFRRALEGNLAQARIHAGRPVAIQATQYTVRADEGEGSGAVIERSRITPGAQFVAALAHALAGFQFH